MPFFCLKNLASSVCTITEEPWVIAESLEKPSLADKQAYTKWVKAITTQGAFISTYEGLTNTVRVDANNNEPFKCHGLIADYDAPLPGDLDQVIENFKTKPRGEFLPQWIHRTFSDQARVIWLFEEPLLCTNNNHWKQFLTVAAKELGLRKWLAGFDEQAFFQRAEYYEIGSEWKQVDADGRIPKDLCQLWMLRAAEKVNISDHAATDYEIPIEDIEKEVHERYPGRWTGPFTIGARGVRFWDKDADNMTAAVVAEQGMICFTGMHPFMSWKQIFGKKFVDGYEADKYGSIINRCAFDGKRFYYLLDEDTNKWKALAKDDFNQFLRVKGFSSSRGRRDTHSETDKIEQSIKLYREVKDAKPILFHKPGLIRLENDDNWYLNLCNQRPLEPTAPFENCEKFKSGAEWFPTIYGILNTMFDQKEALQHMLAWLQHFYVNSYRMRPKQGQLLVLAGHAGKGKTLFVRRIVAALMNSREMDASSYLVYNDKFTGKLAEAPVWSIDDNPAVGDINQLRQFTERVKKYVATASLRVEDKYEKSTQLPHFGRIILTCNTDPQSLQILPSMDKSTRDKISLFRASPMQFDYIDSEELEAAIAAELPFFARHLMEWEVPKHLTNVRFGVDPWHDDELMMESHYQTHGAIMEVILDFLETYVTINKDKTYWAGTALDLARQLAVDNDNMPREFSAKSIGSRLGSMLSKGNYNYAKYRDNHRRVTWVLGADLFAPPTEELKHLTQYGTLIQLGDQIL